MDKKKEYNYLITPEISTQTIQNNEEGDSDSTILINKQQISNYEVSYSNNSNTNIKNNILNANMNVTKKTLDIGNDGNKRKLDNKNITHESYQNEEDINHIKKIKINEEKEFKEMISESDLDLKKNKSNEKDYQINNIITINDSNIENVNKDNNIIENKNQEDNQNSLHDVQKLRYKSNGLNIMDEKNNHEKESKLTTTENICINKEQEEKECCTINKKIDQHKKEKRKNKSIAKKEKNKNQNKIGKKKRSHYKNLKNSKVKNSNKKNKVDKNEERKIEKNKNKELSLDLNVSGSEEKEETEKKTAHFENEDKLLSRIRTKKVIQKKMKKMSKNIKESKKQQHHHHKKNSSFNINQDYKYGSLLDIYNYMANYSFLNMFNMEGKMKYDPLNYYNYSQCTHEYKKDQDKCKNKKHHLVNNTNKNKNMDTNDENSLIYNLGQTHQNEETKNHINKRISHSDDDKKKNKKEDHDEREEMPLQLNEKNQEEIKENSILDESLKGKKSLNLQQKTLANKDLINDYGRLLEQQNQDILKINKNKSGKKKRGDKSMKRKLDKDKLSKRINHKKIRKLEQNLFSLPPPPPPLFIINPLYLSSPYFLPSTQSSFLLKKFVHKKDKHSRNSNCNRSDCEYDSNKDKSSINRHQFDELLSHYPISFSHPYSNLSYLSNFNSSITDSRKT